MIPQCNNELSVIKPSHVLVELWRSQRILVRKYGMVVVYGINDYN
jgi:hypothetical protein